MKRRALVIGAGRIGAGYNWHDLEYTHAGAYKALADRVELVGFVEPDLERRVKANLLWKVPTFDRILSGIQALEPDIVSVCLQPDQQDEAIKLIGEFPTTILGVWCEKPYVSRKIKQPVQVNYMRRGDAKHREIAERDNTGKTLTVYAKDDIHTRCHFEDLAKWWKVPLQYLPIASGPCSYILGSSPFDFESFPIGGVDGGECFRNMLGNLLDHIDHGTPLWSSAT